VKPSRRRMPGDLYTPPVRPAGQGAWRCSRTIRRRRTARLHSRRSGSPRWCADSTTSRRVRVTVVPLPSERGGRIRRRRRRTHSAHVPPGRAPRPWPTMVPRSWSPGCGPARWSPIVHCGLVLAGGPGAGQVEQSDCRETVSQARSRVVCRSWSHRSPLHHEGRRHDRPTGRASRRGATRERVAWVRRVGGGDRAGNYRFMRSVPGSYDGV
jgi:hypothetical protein